MDQMASALGEEGRLLALRCQPAEVEGTVAMPGHLRFWGVDSGESWGRAAGMPAHLHSSGEGEGGQVVVQQACHGTCKAKVCPPPSPAGSGLSGMPDTPTRIVLPTWANGARANPLPPTLLLPAGIRHSVGGSDYGAVRVGAFMGLRIASQLAHERQLQLFQRQQRSKGAGGGTPADAVATDPPALAPVGAGYLVNLPPSLFSSVYEPHLPATITGKAFLEAYGSHWDGATRVDPGTSYAGEPRLGVWAA